MANFYLFSETARQFFKDGKLAEEYSLKLDACPVCDSQAWRKLFSHDGFHYFRCRKCSFVFTNPRLNEKGSMRWYNSDYYNAALAREIYVNSQCEKYYSASIDDDLVWKIGGLVKINFDKSANIIDVGCSTGSILALLKNEYGYTNLKGIDLNRNAVRFAREKRGLDVELADITAMGRRDRRFQLAINTENIEHVNKLEEYILNISNLLEAGGHLLISTPHNDPMSVRLLGLYGDDFCAPNHVNHFSAETIRLFLEKNNFKTLQIDLFQNATFSLYSFLKSKFFVPDQATADPPYEAYLRMPIPRYAKNRRKYVRLRQIANGAADPKPDGNRKGTSFSSQFKRLLKLPLGIKFDRHMVVLARKQS